MPIEAVPRLQPHGSLTYEAFYGLTEKAFSLSSDPSFFYNSAAHTAALDELLSGIRRRESLSMLSGDIGTGKTTLCRRVLKSLDRQTFSAFVADPFSSREDLLKVVLVDFGVVSAGDLATGRLREASRTELSYLLYEFLSTLSPLQAFAVVFIDEAQNLSLPLLEEIRILSDSDGRERQLQVVLVGQPELRDKLRLPEMRQVSQRVSVRCTLSRLDRDDVEGYIACRLHAAGGSPERVRFSREAIDTVFAASGGVPRMINRLCDRALHHGRRRQISVIDGATAARACEEMEGPPVVRAPAAAPAVPPLEGTETWFSETDACVQRAAENETLEFPDLTSPSSARAAKSAARNRTVVPLTRMELLQRRWLRRLKIAVILFVILGGAGFGLTVATNMLMQPVNSPSVGNPDPPALPAALVIPPIPDDDADTAAASVDSFPF
jgi:general secretion pathway protein A